MSTGATWERAPDERFAWLTSTPYVIAHVAALGGAIFLFPPTWELVLVMVGSYYLRMFGITAGYHRYFAHRGYKTGRVFQFLLALLGTITSQKGVLWWAGHHRHHHKHSDMEEDIHSPKRGFWWSHHGWILCPKYDETPVNRIKDFAKYPELMFLNRTWWLWTWVYGGVLYLVGGGAWAFWGALVSTVVLWHGTFTINSLAHVWGSVRYETTDTSKNNFWLALLTMGEGWHNNHHFYQSTARNGFFWWEVDASYYILKVLSWFGVVWDLRQPPKWALEGKQRKFAAAPTPQVGLPMAEPIAVPGALVEAVQGLATLRSDAQDETLWQRLGAHAADAAEKAAEFAQRAAHAAQDSRAAEAAEKAAALAKEAAEAAAEAAQNLKTKAAQKWAEAAAAAAEKAAEAAAQARAARGRLAPA